MESAIGKRGPKPQPKRLRVPWRERTDWHERWLSGDWLEPNPLPILLEAHPDYEAISLREQRKVWVRKKITAALDAHNGNKSAAAASLRISRAAIYRLIEENDIHWRRPCKRSYSQHLLASWQPPRTPT